MRFWSVRTRLFTRVWWHRGTSNRHTSIRRHILAFSDPKPSVIWVVSSLWWLALKWLRQACIIRDRHASGKGSVAVVELCSHSLRNLKLCTFLETETGNLAGQDSRWHLFSTALRRVRKRFWIWLIWRAGYMVFLRAEWCWPVWHDLEGTGLFPWDTRAVRHWADKKGGFANSRQGPTREIMKRKATIFT